ncbi:hypothetical protein [Oceanicella sp. SM1341]|uniref:hypothetical protein n=1 Tax=Oceanicella sp. SM1341 TaxID=1548889 RepID=UPI000E527FB1|nr:hypothetical protein [Oceanicella sp. SM1341]
MVIYLEAVSGRPGRRGAAAAVEPGSAGRRAEGLELLRDSLGWLVPVELSLEHLLDRLETRS